MNEKTFEVRHGVLLRSVVPRRGRPYVQRCTRAVYQEVAHYLDEHAEQGMTTTLLWEALPERPCTQISVALDFLKERGSITTFCRKCYPATACLFEDAMLEFHAADQG